MLKVRYPILVKIKDISRNISFTQKLPETQNSHPPNRSPTVTESFSRERHTIRPLRMHFNILSMVETLPKYIPLIGCIFLCQWRQNLSNGMLMAPLRFTLPFISDLIDSVFFMSLVDTLTTLSIDIWTSFDFLFCYFWRYIPQDSYKSGSITTWLQGLVTICFYKYSVKKLKKIKMLLGEIVT